MVARILRLLATGLNAYTFYSNPTRFFSTILCVIAIPYLTYILWGSLLIMILAILGTYFSYKAIQSSLQNRSTYY